jgi:hypothetical protein
MRIFGTDLVNKEVKILSMDIRIFTKGKKSEKKLTIIN